MNSRNWIRRVKNTTTLIFVMVLLLFTLMPVHAAKDNIAHPTYQVQDTTFSFNNRGTMFIQSEPMHGLVNEQFVTKGSTLQYTFNEEAYNFESTNTVFTDQGGIMHFVNNSANLEDMQYRVSFYDLLSSEGSGELMITANTPYTFKIEVDELKPMLFEILISRVSGTGGGNTAGLTLEYVDSSGFSDSYSKTFTEDVTNFIPFIPKSIGTFYFSFSSNTNIILDKFELDGSPKVIDVATSFTEEVSQDDALAQFIRIESGGADTKLLDLQSIKYRDQYFLDFNTFVTPGDIEFSVFYPSSVSSFGTDTGAINDQVVTNQDVFIAVMGTPANKKSPTVKEAVERKIIKDLLEVEYSVSAQPYELQDLPTNQNFESIIRDGYSETSNSIFYRYTTTSTVMMGVNATIGQNTFLDFISLTPGEPDVSLREADNDILNAITDEPAVIPAGDYYIELDPNQEYYFTTYSVTEISANGNRDVSSTYQQTRFFYLPTGGQNRMEYLNFTYSQQNNVSVQYRFVLYDNAGNFISTLLDTLEYYYNAGSNLQENTVTDIQMNEPNVNGYYLRVYVNSNSKYNDTDGTFQYGNVKNITTTINIERLNRYHVIADQNPGFIYHFSTITTSSDVTYSLPSFNSTIRDYAKISLSANTAYRLTIDSVNRTIVGTDFWVPDGSSWFNPTQTTERVINGIDHYIITIEFASTQDMAVSLDIFYQNAAINGSARISLDTVSIHQVEGISFSLLKEQGLSLLQVGLIVVGGVAVIGIIALLVRRFRAP